MLNIFEVVSCIPVDARYFARGGTCVGVGGMVVQFTVGFGRWPSHMTDKLLVTDLITVMISEILLVLAGHSSSLFPSDHTLHPAFTPLLHPGMRTSTPSVLIFLISPSYKENSSA